MPDYDSKDGIMIHKIHVYISLAALLLGTASGAIADRMVAVRQSAAQEERLKVLEETVRQKLDYSNFSEVMKRVEGNSARMDSIETGLVFQLQELNVRLARIEAQFSLKPYGNGDRRRSPFQQQQQPQSSDN